jgi:hypothetical protein
MTCATGEWERGEKGEGRGDKRVGFIRDTTYAREDGAQ